MAGTDAIRDQNFVPVALGVSSTDATATLPFKINSVTGRVLTDSASGSGTVTSVSVTTANGFAGTVATATTTPAITLTTTLNTPIIAGNGTALIAATTTGSTSTVVLQTSPTLITPLLGTPTSGVLTNCTGYTVANVAGLGTGVATALAINVGSAGAFVTFNGALGTPSSGTVTNLTGTASININGTVGATTAAAGTFTTAIANSFVPNLSTVPSNGMYLPAANTLGWAINSAAELQLTSTALSPAADDGLALGTTALGWQSLFGDTGFVINIENSDWVATHTAGILTVGTGDLRVTNNFTNATSVVTIAGAQTLTNKTLTSPVIAVVGSNTLTLGTGTFTTLTFDAGASDPVITAASGILTVTTGELRITSANVGTNADSVPTLSSTSTFTNKTLTSPTLTTPSAFTTGGNITLADSTSIVHNPSGLTDGEWIGETIVGVAGYAQTFGDFVYLAVADSRFEKTDADAAATAVGLVGVVVVAGGSDGAACTILTRGFINAAAAFPTLTVGAPVYLDDTTAGSIRLTIPTGADNIIRVVGFGWTGDILRVDISQDVQVTVA